MVDLYLGSFLDKLNNILQNFSLCEKKSLFFGKINDSWLFILSRTSQENFFVKWINK